MIVVTVTSLPVYTWNGTKFHETVQWPGQRGPSCAECPYREGCAVDVITRDGFAWCEDVIPVDLDPGYAAPGMHQGARHLGSG